jgi:hypothetical protein
MDTEQIVGKFKTLIDVDTEAGKKEHVKWKEEKLKELKSKLDIISIKTKKTPFALKLD